MGKQQREQLTLNNYEWPTIEAVVTADKKTIMQWLSALPPVRSVQQMQVMTQIYERYARLAALDSQARDRKAARRWRELALPVVTLMLALWVLSSASGTC